MKELICRVIAPSQEVTIGAIKKLPSFLEYRNTRISFDRAKNVSSPDIWHKVDDIHDAFLDKHIDFIMCYTGGFSCNLLLDYVDYELIGNNHKFFCWYSDITVLLNAFYTKTWKQFFHWPMAEDFVDLWVYYKNYTLGKLVGALQNEYVFESSNYRIDSRSNRGNIPMKRGKKNTWCYVLQQWNGTWTLLGWNLCSFNLLQWTQYMPSLWKVIFFLEEDDLNWIYTKDEFYRNIVSLLQQKNLTVQWIVFWRFQKFWYVDATELLEILHKSWCPKDIPILYGADFWHTYPMITFPIGAEVAINTTQGIREVIS